MTLSEFDQTEFHANMWVTYQGDKRYVISVSFSERLLGLVEDKSDVPPDEWSWVRCENVEVIDCQIVHLHQQ